jgi:3'-5' exoribonuclease Rv2179c-like domain
MRFWFDTEFIEDGRTIDLISIGVYAEDGRTYYAESGEVNLERANPWVRKNVLPHLSGNAIQRAKIAADLIAFMGDKPEIWAYYADYDWVVMCQLFGTMMDLPKGWPMYCRDVKQLADSIGNPHLPANYLMDHHALADAKWAAEAWRYLTNNRRYYKASHG